MFKENKRKYLFYGIVAVLLLLSTFIIKAAMGVNADDNNVTIKSAKVSSIKTGVGSFDSEDGIVEDADGNMTSHTAGADSSDSNRLVKSNDQINYGFDFSIGGINNDNAYYTRTVEVTVNLSTEEAKYVSFDANKTPGETTNKYEFNNISSTGGEYSESITLYVVNAPDNVEIAPKFSFVVKDSTSNTPVVLGRNDSGNLDYKYENGQYKNTNRSTVANYLPTIVSSVAASAQYQITPYAEGQKAMYDSQLGRFFTGVVSVYVPSTKGTYVSEENISLPVSTSTDGSGTIVLNDNWVRLYDGKLVDTIDSVVVNAPYSIEGGGTSNNQTRFPGSVNYSGGTMNISGFKVPVNGPGVSATGEIVPNNNKIIGTYAISFFSPRTKTDGKNPVNVTLNVGNQNVTFSNNYYEVSDYNLESGFYDETGSSRLTKYINENGILENLPSSTSKGSTIVYKTNFKYKKTGSDSGLKQVLKVDPIAFRVIPFTDKKDVEVKIICGSEECKDITSEDFEFKFITGDWNAGEYAITDVDPRVSEENQAYASNQCSALASNLGTYSREQVMNLYGGPCIKGNNEEIFDKVNDARNTETDAEKAITKVVVQTKDGVVLPDSAIVEISVKLRIRNVADITRTYQSNVVLSTSDTDSELYYFVPTIKENATDDILNANNYTRSSITGTDITLNSTAPYGDSLRVVNFTARQDLTVTNTKQDGTLKTSFSVDENEIIQYKLSTNIQDFNEQVGADDVWYLKAVKMNVTIPKELDYVADASLGNPEVIDNTNGVKTLVYTIPWTKANFKIPDIYFNTKLSYSLVGSRVPITVTATFNPININDEYDASVIQAKTANFVIYGTQSTTVLLSQTNEGRTVVDRNSEFTYLLHAYNNSGKDVTNYIIEDVLPFNKDGRGSEFSGNYEVKVTLPSSQPRAQVYCSNKDSKTITTQVNSNDNDFKDCNATEEFVKATAIRITGIDLSNGQTMDPIRVTIKTKGNKYSEKYVNSFRGEGDEMVSKESNKIKFSIINRRITGKVFIDSNQDGVKNESEKTVSGIHTTLYKVENGKLTEASKTIDTDKNGNYKFENLEPGFYRVRLEYSNATYDLALRYGSENTATDSDAYKISDGLAEISGKFVPGTRDGIDLTVFDNNNVENMDMGLIPRQVFGFTMKKYITQVDLNYNNTLDSKKYNNESTVSINVRNTLNATAKVYYGMAITNTSTIAGYIKNVHENLPQDLIFDENDPYNAQWKKVGNELQSTVYENDLVEPGETKYLQIALFMPNRETGNTFINNVSADVEKYVPQELAKEAEFKTDTYDIGDDVDFAGVDWHVIDVTDNEDGSQNVTLLADSGTISSPKENGTGSVYKWGNSPILSFINDYSENGWLSKNTINHSILLDQVVCNDASSLQNTSFGGSLLDAGTCTSNDYVTTKVRLLNEADYNRIKAKGLNEFDWFRGTMNYWTMDAVDSTINRDVYGVQTNSGVNDLSKYINSTSGNILADKSMTETLEVRPVITISSKNIIGN